MPEYLAPGVYVEEVSFRAKTIEGVSTSTAGFVGPTRFGPVSGEPELITSRLDFERIYGGLENLDFGAGPRPNYMAHAVRAFFEEGGRRLYVSRVFDTSGDPPPAHYGHLPVAPTLPDTTSLTLHARFPGEAGNFKVTFTLQVGGNVLVFSTAGAGLTRVQEFDVVYVAVTGANPTDPTTPQGPEANAGLHVVIRNRDLDRWELRSGTDVIYVDNVGAGESPQVDQTFRVFPVTVTVEVARPTVDSRGLPTLAVPELIGEFGLDPRSSNGLIRVLNRDPPTRFQDLTIPFAIVIGDNAGPEVLGLENDRGIALARILLGATILDTLPNPRVPLASRQASFRLEDGDDGNLPDSGSYEGISDTTGFIDFVNDTLQLPKNGLAAFESVESISIVAAPGYSAEYGDSAAQDNVHAIQSAVINHCEKMRYRIAVLDVPPDQLVSGALEYRNRRSSKYAALYYPWVTVANPIDGSRLDLPPSGFIAGIYARNDIEHAVFKAPANEVVRLAIDFEQRLSKAQQEALNPSGVNCFRFFPGRGFLVWGARTISDDPEWKYVNLRRYFAYLEHSIDRGTQWVVFENNGPLLWANVRRTVEDFLFNEWKSGGFLGTKPEEAFFVRCDRSTMTQNDLDNGRLICLIGVAPVRPAEFVIFRIGQFTASSPS